MDNKDIPIRLDLPKSVHDELAKLRGGKKPNAERILIEWSEEKAKENGK